MGFMWVTHGCPGLVILKSSRRVNLLLKIYTCRNKIDSLFRLKNSTVQKPLTSTSNILVNTKKKIS